jgi:hypothetical protein
MLTEVGRISTSAVGDSCYALSMSTKGAKMAESVMPGSKGTYTVSVFWHWQDAPGRLHRDTVHLTPGYSDSSDIPAILAIRYGAGTPDTDKVVIDKLVDPR